MTRLQHPIFLDVFVDVEEDVVPRWTAAGWLATEPAGVPDPTPFLGRHRKE